MDICPRCGQRKLNPIKVRNALSRRRDMYICSECGVDEAMHDFFEIADDQEWYCDKENKKGE